MIVPAPVLVERETPLLPQLDWMRPGVVTDKVSALAAAAVHDLGSRLFGPSVARGPGRRRTIALTFDDGPSPGSLEIAEYLAEQGVRATFFQCGENVVRHPKIARAIAWAGHEIGNHTFSHRRLRPRLGWQLNVLSKDQVFDEFARAQTVIMGETGAVPTLLRAPYGLRWRGMREAQRRLELLGVMWTVIGRDWELGALATAERVLSGASQGGIVCLHDGRDTRENPDTSSTLGALKLLIPRLRDEGYGFETVTEILRP